MTIIDFPNAPVVGQIHTLDAISWVWDGVKWETGPTGLQAGYLPLSGGSLTGALSAPQYYLDHVLFASSDANYHYIYDKGGVDAALVLGNASTGHQNFYRGDTQAFQSNNNASTYGVFNAAGLTVPAAINTNHYQLAGVVLAERAGNAHSIYDFDGQPAIVMYGTAGSQTTYYIADNHVFETNDGVPIITLAPGGLTISGAISATSLTVSGTITGALLVSTGGVSAAGNINAAGTVQAQQLTSNGNINAAGNVVTVNLNASSTVNANTVAATGTVSGNLLTGNSVSSNTTVNAAQYNLRGATFATMDASALVTQFSDPQYINISMYTSGTNYYDNSQHVFRSRAASYGGGTTYAIFNAGGSYNQTGGWGVISDDTVKTNVAPYTAGLAQVKQLNPVSFEYTPAALMRAAGETNYGLMASEVQPVVPEMVGEAELEIDGVPSPVQTLLPTHLVYLLVNAVKELSARVEQLEAGTPS